MFHERSAKAIKINWQFSIQAARTKLNSYSTKVHPENEKYKASLQTRTAETPGARSFPLMTSLQTRTAETPRAWSFPSILYLAANAALLR